MSLRTLAPFALVLTASACGARTSLDAGQLDGAAGDGGGGASGSSSEASRAAATTAASATDAASTASGAQDCTARTLDVGGVGAVVLRTSGEIAFYSTLDGRIMRGDLETGDERVLASGKDSLGDLAIHDGALYFSDAHAIARVPLDGGEETTVVDLPSTSYAIAVDATGVYWVEGPGSLAGHTIERLRPDGTRLTLATNVQYPLGLSVGPSGVVYTDPYDFTAEAGTVRAVSIDGGSPTLVASSEPYPELPFQRDGAIYWVQATDEAITNHGGIARGNLDGRPSEKVLALDRQYPVWAMTDGTHYFLTVLTEALGTQVIAARYPVAGAQTIVAERGGEAYFTMVATTPKRVVWTVQPGTRGSAPVDGVESRCLGDVAFE